MSEVLKMIKEYVEAELPMYEAEQEEINEMLSDDFNACDASGGNFDDAYRMGDEHGDTYGRLLVLRKIKSFLDLG